MSDENLEQEKTTTPEQTFEALEEVISQAPDQAEPIKWEYPPRQHPKWGTITKQGLIVGRGENRKVVPPDEVFKLASMGCTLEEMSDWFGVKRETLKYNFRDYIAKGQADLKQRLRQAQVRAALTGNATLLIWLGKNILGQQDNPTHAEDQQPLPWTDDDKPLGQDRDPE